MIAWLTLLAVTMNLFILKQITLFGLNVTSTDALAVGYLLGLNLIQEFFGKESARQTTWISLFLSSAFVLLSQIHLAYTPNAHDLAHPHFAFLLAFIPRIIIASLFSFVVTQLFDLSFFGFLREKTAGKCLTRRTALALILSQTMDTLLFSFLGLTGVLADIGHVILLSLAIKGFAICLSTPFVYLSKRIMPRYEI